jgi:hypothetical protein
MIKVKIVILTIHRKWFDMYAKIYNDRVQVLRSRTIQSKVFGQRDHIIIHGNVLHIINFTHMLGNKHCRMTAVKYQVTPYAVANFKN